MIVTNLNHVPGRRVFSILGTVSGYSEGERKGEDASSFYNDLIERAQEIMIARARSMGADAVLGVNVNVMGSVKTSREVLVIGTAVVLEEGEEEPREVVSLSMDGSKIPWSQPPATPSSDVVRMIRMKGREEREKVHRRKDIYDLADEIGISYDRAKLLFDSGFRNIDDIANASARDISSIEGINPTQARILKRRAQEILEMEREL